MGVGAGSGPDLAWLRASLERTPRAVRGLLEGLGDEDARWRPGEGDWSILEVVNHLADEDAEDFPVRLESTLRDPAAAWAALDPEGVARERRYNERVLGESLARFEDGRRAALGRLDRLLDAGEPDLAVAYEHPKLGPIPAGVLLVSWVAHDHLHVKQIAKRLFQLAERHGGGYSTLYAGEWGA